MVGRGPRVLVAPAAGPEIGGGHLMRQLALHEAMRARGAETVFAVTSWGARLLARFGERPPEIFNVERSSDPALLAHAVEAMRPDLLIVDDYTLAGADVAPLRRRGMSVAVVDDLADRDHACDLLIDPGFGRREADYAGLVPPGCRVLCGPRYALLRPAFRRGSEPPAPTRERIERVFVSFGLSDVERIAARAVARLRRRLPKAYIDVALASDAASLPELEALADPGLALHPDARDVAGLIAAADLALGAGGSSTWERFALGAPTLAVVVADNQAELIGRLAARGALLACDARSQGFEADFDAALEALRSPELRRRLAAAGSAMTDGRGAERAAEALLALTG